MATDELFREDYQPTTENNVAGKQVNAVNPLQVVGGMVKGGVIDACTDAVFPRTVPQYPMGSQPLARFAAAAFVWIVHIDSFYRTHGRHFRSSISSCQTSKIVDCYDKFSMFVRVSPKTY